jgi:hypothetical protein
MPPTRREFSKGLGNYRPLNNVYRIECSIRASR